ncbi:MAG: YgiQ family radical SAM protein [Methanomicrobiales archaeon]|nr:YgiQ family radical SAM protein [Methanomicrobiales archaeon]
MIDHPHFLPMSRREAESLGIDRFDVILVSGDAYVDHPSFGAAIIGRVLWDAGYTTGVIAQPDWRSDADFTGLGRPRLFFSVSSGAVDSMVNHYTARLRRRSGDAYSPGGALKRPDRAVIVYANRLRALFPGTPIVLGGIEASLRRFAHYDYWSDSVRQSILADAPGDLLVFGMGERQVTAIAARLANGEGIQEIRDVPGTVMKLDLARWRSMPHEGFVVLPSYTEVAGDRKAFARAFALHAREQDPFRGRPVAQVQRKIVVVQNPPAKPLSTAELDRIYELPYRRLAHPSYREPVPALETVQFSVTSHRGCFGCCSFCAIAHHQGRIIQSRSIESIVREVERMTGMPEFRGTVQDVGGPTANMFGARCRRWCGEGACRERTCGAECPSLQLDHARQIELLRRLRQIPGVRHVFIGSGIRHDLVLADQAPYLAEICRYHVSGHLKVAPEHISPAVTRLMHKPGIEVFEEFRRRFQEESEKIGREQYILPYFLSGHPGCRISDMVDLAEYIRDRRLYTEQVQDFTPTPMTASTCMYCTGIDPFSGEPVHVPRGREKRIQRALLQYRDRRNRSLVMEGLRQAGRSDLIGSAWTCLVPGDGGCGSPRKSGEESHS